MRSDKHARLSRQKSVVYNVFKYLCFYIYMLMLYLLTVIRMFFFFFTQGMALSMGDKINLSQKKAIKSTGQ